MLDKMYDNAVAEVISRCANDLQNQVALVGEVSDGIERLQDRALAYVSRSPTFEDADEDVKRQAAKFVVETCSSSAPLRSCSGTRKCRKSWSTRPIRSWSSAAAKSRSRTFISSMRNMSRELSHESSPRTGAGATTRARFATACCIARGAVRRQPRQRRGLRYRKTLDARRP